MSNCGKTKTNLAKNRYKNVIQVIMMSQGCTNFIPNNINEPTPWMVNSHVDTFVI